MIQLQRDVHGALLHAAKTAPTTSRVGAKWTLIAKHLTRMVGRMLLVPHTPRKPHPDTVAMATWCAHTDDLLTLYYLLGPESV